MTAGIRRGRPAGQRRRRVTGDVTVFAAASLTESFTPIGKDFEAANPGTKVDLQLRRQLRPGHADQPGRAGRRVRLRRPATMKTVTDAGNADGTPATFVQQPARHRRAQGQPERASTGLADLTRPGVKVALCAEQVPCGAAAKKALDAAGVTLTPVTLEQDVKAALTKVKLGEVDAALVYRTDAQGRRRRRGRRRVPRVGRRDQRLPDRRAQGRPQPGRRPGVRRATCCPTQGQAVLDRGRLPGAVTPVDTDRDDSDGGRGAGGRAAAPPAAGCRCRCCCPPRSGCVPGAAAGRAARPRAVDAPCRSG